MATGDIQFWSTSSKEKRIAYAWRNTGAEFFRGEPVTLTSGGLVRAGDDPPVVHGISTNGTRDIDNKLIASGTLMTIHEADNAQSFSCRNFATDGAGTAVTPTAANAIGKLAGFTLLGSSWVVDTGCNNLILEVEGVMTSRGFQIGAPNAVGGAVTVVFKFA